MRVARELRPQIRALTRAIRELERELARPGRRATRRSCSPSAAAAPLTAAKLIGEIAGAERFATDAKFARTAGAAPIPASSGNTNRHRLDRGGNRQLNCALHRLAITKARLDPETAAYLARKQAEGKTRKRSAALPQAPPRPPRLPAAPATASASPQAGTADRDPNGARHRRAGRPHDPLQPAAAPRP